MFTIFEHIRNRYFGQKGQGIVEYALILAFVVGIAVWITSDNTGLGQKIKDLFTNIGGNLDSAKTTK